MALFYFFNNTLVFAGNLDADPVSAGDLTFLAPGEAEDFSSIRQFDPILPPIGGDDYSVVAAVWFQDEVCS